MSLFQQLAASVYDAHAEYFAVDVSVLQPGSTAQTVKAVLGKARTETRVGENGRRTRVTVRNCRFVTLSDVRHDSLVTIDGYSWVIEDVLRRDASGLHVRLERVAVNEAARPNYRGRP